MRTGQRRLVRMVQRKKVAVVAEDCTSGCGRRQSSHRHRHSTLSLSQVLSLSVYDPFPAPSLNERLWFENALQLPSPSTAKSVITCPPLYTTFIYYNFGCRIVVRVFYGIFY